MNESGIQLRCIFFLFYFKIFCIKGWLRLFPDFVFFCKKKLLRKFSQWLLKIFTWFFVQKKAENPYFTSEYLGVLPPPSTTSVLPPSVRAVLRGAVQPVLGGAVQAVAYFYTWYWGGQYKNGTEGGSTMYWGGQYLYCPPPVHTHSL